MSEHVKPPHTAQPRYLGGSFPALWQLRNSPYGLSAPQGWVGASSRARPSARRREEMELPGRAPEAGPSPRPACAALRPGVAAGRAPGDGERWWWRLEGLHLFPDRADGVDSKTVVMAQGLVTFGTRPFSEGAVRKRSLEKLKLARTGARSEKGGKETGLKEAGSCVQLESLRNIQGKCKKMFHKKVKFKTLHTTMAAPDVTPCDGSLLQETLQRTGDERRLMLRKEMDADVRGGPLFPLEIIQTDPCSDTFCGAEPRRGC
ncbi:uncharacterized protein AAGF69_007754 [Amazona ochrocephala]